MRRVNIKTAYVIGNSLEFISNIILNKFISIVSNRYQRSSTRYSVFANMYSVEGKKTRMKKQFHSSNSPR